MRTTFELSDDALLIARQVATHEGVSLGEAISRLVRAGADTTPFITKPASPLRGRFALLPRRDEVVTCEHVRELL
jgi:hypothetical protein